MSEAFYLLDGDDVLSTEWTRGPWDEGAQHGGPPAALLGRAIERLEPVGELQMVRVTVELLRPIPIDRLRVHARVLRPGYKVQFAEATLRSGDREVARATAWRMRTNDVTRDSIGLESPTFPDPEGLPSLDIDVLGDGPSYFRALEWRFSNGSFPEPGPATAWMRMRIPLVAGEVPSPLTRVLVAADSASGIAGELPMDRYRFINTDLTVTLVRMPDDEWVGFDAISRIASFGIGVAESSVWDRRGRIGVGSQSLLIEPAKPRS